MIDIIALKADLIRDEGLRLKPYRDTVGKMTIGVGRNLDDMGITAGEADHLLENDIGRALDELRRTFAWFDSLGEPQQRALANMTFNMGLPRLLGFRRMLDALKRGDYRQAAIEARDSRWAAQVGDRAWRVSKLMEGE